MQAPSPLSDALGVQVYATLIYLYYFHDLATPADSLR